MAELSNSTDRAGWELLFRNETFPPRYQTLAAPNESVVAWADSLAPGISILDVGCGIGRHVVYLGGRGFKMAGMDIAPIGVQRTQSACEERQLDFDGRVSAMSHIPWEAMTFDAVLSTSTIAHNRRVDLEKTIGEIWRVLKPGGLFLVDFLHKETLSYQRVCQQAAAGEITEVEPDTFVDTSPDPDPTSDAFLPHHYSDEAEVRDLLHDFEIVSLWADLSGRPPEGGLGQRGYWVAWARKPHAAFSY
jgi:tellurite methyltransferase